MFEQLSNNETYTGGNGQQITHGFTIIAGVTYVWRFEFDVIANEGKVEVGMMTAGGAARFSDHRYLNI